MFRPPPAARCPTKHPPGDRLSCELPLRIGLCLAILLARVGAIPACQMMPVSRTPSPQSSAIGSPRIVPFSRGLLSARRVFNARGLAAAARRGRCSGEGSGGHSRERGCVVVMPRRGGLRAGVSREGNLATYCRGGRSSGMWYAGRRCSGRGSAIEVCLGRGMSARGRRRGWSGHAVSNRSLSWEWSRPGVGLVLGIVEGGFLGGVLGG